MTTVALQAEYTKREQNGWCWYDAANSVFATSAISLFLPTYVPALAKAAADSSGYVHPFGIPILAASFWAYLVGLSVFAQILVLPVVGAIADFSRKKREVLGVTAFIGSIAAAAMFLLQGSGYLLAAGLFLVANVAFGASIVVYNSFLPEIAPPDERDALSSKGWAIGYGAGCVMLLAHLFLLARAESFGITTGFAVRIALCSTGIWWALFTIPVLMRVKNRGTPRALPPGKSTIGVAFGQLWHTVGDMRQYPNTMRFLIAYLLYNDAIQTVLVVAAQFGAEELHLAVTDLTITILISQLVGVAGALLFNKLAQRITAKKAVMVTLVVWIALLFYAYFFVHNATEFYIMGAFAGLVMGGSQALSRSIFAQLVPHGMEAEYFSIYEVGDKGTSWMGPPTFGLALQLTGSYRIAILSLLIFFVAGLGVLTTADVKQGEWDVLKSA
ncbi:MAG: MFS transporter [Acidobacteriota bacterium]